MSESESLPWLIGAAVVCLALIAVFLLSTNGAEPADCTGVRGFHPLQCPSTVTSMQAMLAASCAGNSDLDAVEPWSSHAVALASASLCSALRAAPLDRPVVIVGAGPVGLMNALALVESGIAPDSVIVVEEREDYSRDTWFDLDAATQHQLRRWGSGAVKDFGIVTHSGTSTISVRCQVLERFLSKTAAAVGVRLLYGTRFMGRCGSAAVLGPVARGEDDWSCERLPAWTSLVVAVRLLIAADGSRSIARESLGLSYSSVDAIFPIPSFHDDYDTLLFAEDEKEATTHAVTVPDLSQVSIIIRLRPGAGGICAETRDMLPWEPSFAEQLAGQVTHVFKRNFENYCEIQILLTRACGLEALRRHSTSEGTDRLPLQLVLDVLAVVLEKPFESERGLLTALQYHAGEPYVLVFPIAIHRVTPGPLVLNGDLIGYVVGDAKMTAYYRLGIGINAAADDLRFTRELAGLLSDSVLDQSRWNRLVRYTEDQTYRNAQYQAASVFFEAFCDLLVLQDADADVGDFLSRMLVFRKTAESYESHALESFYDALQYCKY